MATGRPSLERSLTELVEGLGYQCLDLQWLREGGRRVLRITLDIEGGVSLEDCEAVARGANPLLDVQEAAFSEPFFLEVSSPGPDRPLVSLADFRRFQGSWIRISWKNGKKKVLRIETVEEDGTVSLVNREGEALRLPWSEIRRPQLHPET